MKKPAILILFLLFIFSCKKDEIPENEFDGYPPILIWTGYHNTMGKICFVDMPVVFRPGTNYQLFSDLPGYKDFRYQWEFGDGIAATEEIVEHTYNKPGSYQPRLTIYLNNDSLSTDTSIMLSFYPQILEKTSATENGKFLFQTDDNAYSILYTYNTGTSYQSAYLINYMNNEIVSKNDLEFNWYNKAKNQLINPAGNLVLITDTWFKEFTNEGSLLTNKQIWGAYNFIQNYNSGYLLLGNDENVLRVEELNSSGDIINAKSYNLKINGFNCYGTSLSSNAEIFLHYIDTNYNEYENRHTLLRKINADSSIVWQKEYDFPTGDRMVKLNDGYMLYGLMESWMNAEAVETFTRLDNYGNLLWNYKAKMESLYYSGINGPGTCIFEDGDEIVIYFDNMRCIKLDNSGNLVFERYYALSYDVFNCAIRNNAGNYMVLGSRQFDEENHEITFDYTKRDLLIIQIDGNGEPMGQAL